MCRVMTLYIMFFIGTMSVAWQTPDLGVRISVWFIGMFLLALGGALVYLRMKEQQEERKNRNSSDA